MIFTTYEDADGRYISELDVEAIDYLIDGLLTLRGELPGAELVTPSVVGDLECMSEYVLRRAEDAIQ